MLNRFSRTELILGSQNMDRLKNSEVAIFGLGGVGAYTAEALARSGVGKLVLVDYDDICLTNINRQIIALQSTVGQQKVDVMEERVKQINPRCEVVTFKEFYDADNSEKLLSSDYNYVVDAIDTVGAKLDLIKRCYERKIPIISSMGAGNKLDPTLLQVADISQTHTCPLARVIRLELRRAGITKGIQVVFSTEKPLPTREDAATCKGNCICPNKDEQIFNCTQRRSIPGSSAFVPPAAGLAMASVVVRGIIENME